MKNPRTFLSLMLTLFLVSITFAQQGTVSGTVSDADGAPLPGATVVVKGTTTGVTTDFDGNFSIQASSDATLVASFVGFASQEIQVNNQSSLSITLKPNSQLDEVIVVGYGTTTKRDATGAVDAISAADFDQVSADSPAQLLRGKVSGVQVTSVSGEPGAGVAIRVRGNSSIRSGNEPLIVVDGVPLSGGNTSSGLGDQVLGSGSPKNPLNFINQNDIESINVLKDASSTAVYGARGANGVIVITTKKGKAADVPRINYSSSVSFSSFAQNSSFEDVMSRADFIANLPSGSSVTSENGSYNWQDVLLRSATSSNHDLSLSTGGQNSSTRLSIGANLQDGIVNKTGMDKYNVSLYNSYRLFDSKVNIQTRVLYSDVQDQSHLVTNTAGYIGNLIGTALYWRPTLDVFDSSGKYTNISDDYVNPKELLDAYDDTTSTKRLLANINVSVALSDKLTFRTVYGIDNSTSNREAQLLPTIDIRNIAVSGFTTNNGNTARGLASLYDDDRLNKTFENTFTYIDNFDGLDVNFLLGYSYYSYSAEGRQFHVTGFNPDQTNLIDNLEGVIGDGKNHTISTNAYKNETEFQSYFARASLTYDKFLATLTFRRDGASKFGKNKKYGNFPAVGLGYKIFENESGVLNNLKLRGSWGITGNSEFAVNSAIAKSEFVSGRPSTPNSANDDLEWETTTSVGVGLDFEALEGKLTGSVDYFQRSTEDLIFPVPEASGHPAPSSLRYRNLPGELVNTGFEVGLNYALMDTDDVTWDVSANASFLSNELQDLPGFHRTGAIHGQGLSGANAQILTSGHPIYSYNIFEFRGYDSSGASLYTQPDGSAGGLGTASKVLDKQGLPKTNVGFSTALSFGNWSLSTAFYGAFGHYVYNNTANAYFFRGAYPVRNIPGYVVSSGQAIADPNSPSTKFLEKGDFLRWSNLNIGYDLGDFKLGTASTVSARMFLNADNLATFTNYSGFDPEIATDKSLGGIPSAGMDYLSYPRARTFTLGVNLTF